MSISITDSIFKLEDGTHLYDIIGNEDRRSDSFFKKYAYQFFYSAGTNLSCGLTFIRNVKRSLDSFYGEEFWDFVVIPRKKLLTRFDSYRFATGLTGPTSVNYYYSDEYLNLGNHSNVVGEWALFVIIKHEDFVIKNRNFLEHFIQGLISFVPIVINRSDKTRLSFTTPYGGRVSTSLREQQNGYAHSHLPGTGSTGVTYISRYCTGRENFEDVLCDMVFESKSRLEGIITRYFMLLQSLVEYESLEGTPYKDIQNVVDQDKQTKKFYNPSHIIDEKLLGKTFVFEHTDYNFNDKGLLVINTLNNGFEKDVKTAMKRLLAIHPQVSSKVFNSLYTGEDKECLTLDTNTSNAQSPEDIRQAQERSNLVDPKNRLPFKDSFIKFSYHPHTNLIALQASENDNATEAYLEQYTVGEHVINNLKHYLENVINAEE